MDDTVKRIDELETRAAFQEDLIARLDDALIAQQTRMDQLENRLEMLVSSLAELGGGEAAQDPAQEVPPHY